MNLRTLRTRVGLTLVLVTRGTLLTAQAEAPPAAAEQTHVLDVPFLPQSLLLCGGAAISMVERWWGKRSVYAEEFASLVKPGNAGITTSDLAKAVAARGWKMSTWHGTAEAVQRTLADSVPVVALIAVKKNQYHYVVILGWRDDVVTFHDPAGLPHTTMSAVRFTEQWHAADDWMLVITPAPGQSDSLLSVAASTVTVDSLPCRPWLDRAVDATAANRMSEAAALLESARRACPEEKLILRELAGVRFQSGDYSGALSLAQRYTEDVPGDTLGWQILATTRYLLGDQRRALSDWNRIGEPTIDLLRIDGTVRTRFQAIANAAVLTLGAPLTPNALALADRRISDIPALKWSALSYLPVGDGMVEVRVAAVERPLFEQPSRLLLRNAVSAFARHEIGLTTTNAAHLGETWNAQWRWDEARQRIAIGLAAPVVLGAPGVLAVAGTRERTRFGEQALITEESRRSITASFGSWITPVFRPAAGIAFDRWSGEKRYVAATASADFRLFDDRFAAELSVTRAAALGNHHSYSQGSTALDWRSSPIFETTRWTARAGINATSSLAPIGASAQLGGNGSAAIPLRGHPLIVDDAVPMGQVARTVAHYGIGIDQPLVRSGALTFGIGAFVDGATIMQRQTSMGQRRFLDVGGGLRIGLPLREMGLLRIDAARSMIGKRSWALTAGIEIRE